MKKHTRDTIIAQINKRVLSGKANSADVSLLWMRLILTEPEIWEPLFKIWCTESHAKEVVQVLPDPYDRGGK